MATTYRGQNSTGPARKPSLVEQIFPGATKMTYKAPAASKVVNVGPWTGGAVSAPTVQPGSTTSLRAAEKKYPALDIGGYKDYPQPKKSTAKKSTPAAVARKLGVAAAVIPKAAPVDPLDALQTQYAGYLSGAYGGLETALQGNADQYKTRSQEIADRLKAQYADASNVANNMGTAAQNELAQFAQRMGLQQATQGAPVQDWLQQNQRLKALNSAAEANSLGTNDLIRSNYYDFLIDKISSAKGAEATSQAGLLDVVAQAKLARQQAILAAAQAAARARAARSRRSGGSSSGKTTGTDTDTMTTTMDNSERAKFLQDHPEMALAMAMKDEAYSNYIGDAATRNKPTGTSSLQSYERGDYEPPSVKVANVMADWVLSGKSGGPVTKITSSGKNTTKSK